MQKTQIKGVLFLLLTAFIWGIAFVAQTVGMESIGALTFSGVRMLLGAAVLLPVFLVKNAVTAKKLSPEALVKRRESNRRTWIYGAILGVVFCLASNLQQFSLLDSAPGKVAFITAIYIFFVPLIGLFLKKRISAIMWFCVALGFVGLYFLCFDGSAIGGMSIGDLLALGCALAFAVHILLIERFVSEADGLLLSCVQFLVSGVISSVLMFIFEKPSWDAILVAAIPLLYAGVMSCGVAYTLQIIGQKYTESTMASLIMCMESVFAVLASMVLLGDMMSGREIFGCVVMFIAITLPQIVTIIKERKENKD